LGLSQRFYILQLGQACSAWQNGAHYPRVESSNQLLGDPFFDLLEASAEEARCSVRLLAGLLEARHQDPQAFALARQKSGRLAAEIATKLARTIMASLRKEDIGALSGALDRIPASVERFAERLVLARKRLPGMDFSGLVPVVGTAMDALVGMVGQLRWFESTARARELNAQSEAANDVAEKAIEELRREFCNRGGDPIEVLIIQDVFGHLQVVFDQCRDAAELVDSIVLKYS
jgi:uncharacterized protein Yka (UPF0111/DUF47 family)